MTKPMFVEILEKSDPQLASQMNALSEFANRDGALPTKVKTLMAMLADAILGHGDGVRAIAERARAQGATEQEIAETVRVAFSCGGIPALVCGTYAFKR